MGTVGSDDVEMLARALDASESTVARLVRQAERRPDDAADWRRSLGPETELQRQVEQIEAGARVFRDFESAVIPGILQTSEYARAVLRAASGCDRRPSGPRARPGTPWPTRTGGH